MATAPSSPHRIYLRVAEPTPFLQGLREQGQVLTTKDALRLGDAVHAVFWVEAVKCAVELPCVVVGKRPRTRLLPAGVKVQLADTRDPIVAALLEDLAPVPAALPRAPTRFEPLPWESGDDEVSLTPAV